MILNTLCPVPACMILRQMDLSTILFETICAHINFNFNRNESKATKRTVEPS